MRRAAARMSESAETVTTFRVMTSSRRSSSSRARSPASLSTSRSVKMPTSREPSHTATAPTFSPTMRPIAACTLSSGATRTRRTLMTSTIGTASFSRFAGLDAEIESPSVAEDRGALADPLPEGRRPGELRVRDELPLVELAGVEADGADEKLAAPVGVLLDQPGERWTALAGDRLTVALETEAHGLLRQEHRHLLPLLDSGAADEEGDRDALGVLEAGREVDDDLVGVLGHARPPLGVVGVGGDAGPQLLVAAVHVRMVLLDVLAGEAHELLVVGALEVVSARTLDRSHLATSQVCRPSPSCRARRTSPPCAACPRTSSARTSRRDRPLRCARSRDRSGAGRTLPPAEPRQFSRSRGRCRAGPPR